MREIADEERVTIWYRTHEVYPVYVPDVPHDQHDGSARKFVEMPREVAERWIAAHAAWEAVNEEVGRIIHPPEEF